jgi:hypothetical protein
MMRFLTHPLRLGVFFAVLFLAAVPQQAAAQRDHPRPRTPIAFQTHAFRHILFTLKLQALGSFQELDDHVTDTVVIVLGDTAQVGSDLFRKSLLEFVKAGGAVLIATDRKPGLVAERELQQVFGVTVLGKTFLVPGGQPDVVYRGTEVCPFLTSHEVVAPDLLRGPRFGPEMRLNRVATNAPSCLVPGDGPLPEGIHRLARLPAEAEPETPGSVLRLNTGRWIPQPDNVAASPHGPLFAVGGEIGTGRILLLADHSIFINQMLNPSDNQNVEFTFNCLDYLRGEGENRRGYVLLVDDGEICTDLDVPLQDVPGLPPGAERMILAAADKALGKLEEQNAFNRGLVDWLTRHGDPRRTRLVLRILVAGASLLLLVWIAYRVGIRGRFRLDTTVPLLATAVVQQAPAGTLLEQRRDAALAGGNVWETARDLARQWAAGLPHTANGRPPRVALRGSWWQRWTMHRRFQRLWKLAHRTEPTPVSPRALRRLLVDLGHLEAARAAGALAFTHPETRA